MSLFPRFSHEFSPFFRLLDDYDRASRSALNEASSNTFKTFAPKFDVREVKDAYELHGELPGIEQKNVNIEWADGNTLTISGRTEHRRESGNAPALEGSSPTSAKLIGNGEASSKENATSKQPTVEDENTAGEATSQQQQVTKTAGSDDSQQQVSSTANTPSPFKYWVTERSVGEFHRSFSFPDRVDHDNVKASLKNGILSIVVPKAKRAEPRKVHLSSE